ncbi:MAG TPA: HAMP domain-containing histidine kinase [Gammaproteobacteria bacterium]|nr:HAMP domain-containing histidine kinase [Gammaproteobacteria bacterium]
MNLARLLRTTAIRLSLRYALFYTVLAGLGLGVLYWATSQYVDLQISAGLKRELSKLVELDKKQGRNKLLEVISRQAVVDIENPRYYLLLSSSGKKLAGHLIAWPPSVVADKKVRNILIEDSFIPFRAKNQDGYWPVIAATLPDGNRLLITQSIRQAENLREFILNMMIVILAVFVALTLFLGFRMGNTILRRIDRINGTARLIQQGDLSRRVSLAGSNDEFDELSRHLNEMLLHIERLVNGMQEVTDNIAHDLRHPLSRLRNRFEISLLNARDENTYRQTIEHSLSDIEDIFGIFNALLEIAQTEAGSYRGEWKEVDLSSLIRDVAELYEGNTENNSQHLEIRIEPDIRIKGNRHLLGQATSNLMENAVKYAGSGNQLSISLLMCEGYPLLSVGDNGPGISPADYHEVLKRFVRLDVARSTPGNGLGLSLVSAVAKLHRAELVLKDNHPGLRVEIYFTAGEQTYPGNQL